MPTHPNGNPNLMLTVTLLLILTLSDQIGNISTSRFVNKGLEVFDLYLFFCVLCCLLSPALFFWLVSCLIFGLSLPCFSLVFGRDVLRLVAFGLGR